MADIFTQVMYKVFQRCNVLRQDLSKHPPGNDEGPIVRGFFVSGGWYEDEQARGTNKN